MINCVVYMAAPMSMPATFASSGWICGSIFLAYSSVITLQTGLLLGEICIQHPELDSYPAISAQCFGTMGERLGLSLRASQRFGSGIAHTMQFLAFYLDSAAQCLYVAQYLDQLMPDTVCVWQWLLVTWAAAIPILQIPTFHESRWFAMGTLVAVIFIVATFVYEVVLVKPWACEPGPEYELPTSQDIFLSLSAFAYAFGGHGMYPEEIRELSEPREWPKVLATSYTIIVPMYVLCSVVGYYSYGAFSQANINLNFPNNDANILSIVVQLVFTYYCIFVTSLVVMLSLERSWLRMDPTEGWAQRKHGIPSPIIRGCFRVLFVGSQVLLCQVLLSGTGDTLLAMQSLAGAVGMSAFTYTLPFLFHWELFGETLGPIKKGWYLLNIFVGLVIMGGGLWAAMSDLHDASTGTLFDSACHLAYAYSPTNPDDPCYISGNVSSFDDGRRFEALVTQLI